MEEDVRCSTPAESVRVTPSVPVYDLQSLCTAFRAQPAVRNSRYGCGSVAVSSEAIMSLTMSPPTLEYAILNGLGTPMSIHASSQPVSDEEIRARGMEPESFREWARVAIANNVARIERWQAVIPDPYHGQPGLVVRTDVAFGNGGHWRICMDDPSELLTDNALNPPDGWSCAKTANQGWWECQEPSK